MCAEDALCVKNQISLHSFNPIPPTPTFIPGKPRSGGNVEQDAAVSKMNKNSRGTIMQPKHLTRTTLCIVMAGAASGFHRFKSSRRDVEKKE
jgi:hypothetical protein